MTGEPGIRMVEQGGLSVACTDDDATADGLKLLRRVWGVGFDVHGLAGSPVQGPPDFSERRLADRLAGLEAAPGADVILFQSGMAAISCLAAAAALLGRRFVLIGPAYVDTLILAREWTSQMPGLAGTWLSGSAPLESLEAELRLGPALVLFEVPANPVLTIPDVDGITRLALEHGAWLAADATVATPYNCRPLGMGFDVVVHSSSKFLGGKLDHLGGVACGTRRELLAAMSGFADDLDLRMCGNQMRLLLGNLEGFERRMEIMNRSAAEIAGRLGGSRAIRTVWYPGSQSLVQEERASRFLSPGRSGLISFVLRDEGIDAMRDFYDRVGPPVRKGPSLGGEETLLSPYVMMAHYRDDPAFLAQAGLPFHLLRLSVGTEPVEDIWRALGIEG